MSCDQWSNRQVREHRLINEKGLYQLAWRNRVLAGSLSGHVFEKEKKKNNGVVTRHIPRKVIITENFMKQTSNTPCGSCCKWKEK